MPPYGLLLLPPPPRSTSLEQIKAAYEPAVSAVLTKLSECLSDRKSTVAGLDVAVEVPGLVSLNYPRSRIFANLQHLLANVYNVLCVVSAMKRVVLDAPGGIDASVIFVDSYESQKIPEQGPMISVRTLAESNRPWDFIFHVQSISGEKFAQAFHNHHQAHRQAHTLFVPAGGAGGGWEEITASSLVTRDNSSLPTTPNYSVAVGGTFDHLHIGHKLLLTATALALDSSSSSSSSSSSYSAGPEERLLTIGVTGDELLVNKKYADYLESWDQRCHSAASFLSAIMNFSGTTAPATERVSQSGPNGEYVLVKLQRHLALKLVQISDAFGPTVTDRNISAIVVSAETRSGGKAINEEREKKGWKGLEVFEIDVLLSGDAVGGVGEEDDDVFGSKISSTEIRRHRMDLAKGSL